MREARSGDRGGPFAYRAPLRHTVPVNTTHRRRLIGAVVVWAVLLAGLAFLWPDRSPTVKEQVGAGESRPAATDAMAMAVREVSGYEDATFTLGGFARSEDCDVTPIRAGVAYAQTLAVYAAPENAATVFDRLYQALKNEYTLVNNHDGGYVGIGPSWTMTRLSPGGDGPMTWTVDTGCRPADVPVAQFQTPGDPTPEASAVVSALAAGTPGAPSPRWTREEVPCPPSGSGTAGTVTTTVKGVTSEAAAQAAALLPVYGNGGAGTAQWHVGWGTPAGGGKTSTVLTWDPATGDATVSASTGCA